MKHKTTAIFALLALLTLSPNVMAEGFGMDFDGRNSEPATFPGIKDALTETQVIQVNTPVPGATGDFANFPLNIFPTVARKNLEEAISKNPLLYGDNTQELVSSPHIRAFYNDTRVLFIRPKDGKYELIQESDNPRLTSLLKEIHSTAPMTRQATLICEFTEAVVMHCLWKVIDGAYTQVCKEVTEIVKQCHEEEGPEPPSGGAGSTYHNNSGGSSNYDVNRHLK
jgi:hypothetical protein